MKTKEEAREIIARIEDQIHKVIIGQDDLIRRILIALSELENWLERSAMGATVVRGA